MLVFSGYEGLPDAGRGAVVVLGNFDGVHRGHAGLLAFARQQAARLGAPRAVLTFEPHPRRYFCPDCPPFQLTTMQSRRALLEALGVDILYELPFASGLADMDADAFAGAVLAEGIRARAVVAGADFRFGNGRKGSLDHLRQDGRFEALQGPVILDEAGIAISSSRVRAALAQARPSEAAALLGRDWDIPYIVETGDRRGRTLGYPTANGRLGDLLRPAFGIYAVRARLANGSCRDGVANIGIRPMWQSAEPLVEAHLFDFEGDLYGQPLALSLVAYLRAEAKFNGVEALLAQMKIDCMQAHEALESAT